MDRQLMHHPILGRSDVDPLQLVLGGDYALDFYSDLKTLQILDGTTA